MNKIALITGITGQDGSYLAELLISKGYIVHGIIRRSSLINTQRINHLYETPQTDNPKLILHYGDLTDSLIITKLISKIMPDEIYNLAAQSHVGTSFEIPEYTSEVNAIGTLRILEAIRISRLETKTRFYQAATSEMFGFTTENFQNENTKFYPRSPYAVSKLFSYWITINYREAHNLFACNGILFNHESNRRGETFVSKKITKALCRIVSGLQKTLFLGNLEALRDWGHAKDYVEMQWLMLQKDKPDDYVIATGQQISVREFTEKAANYLGIKLKWEGHGLKEVGKISQIDSSKNYNIEIDQVIIKIDKKYIRPTEVDTLLGDSTKAKKLLGWEPKYNIDMLIKEMITRDLIDASNEKLIMSKSKNDK